MKHSVLHKEEMILRQLFTGRSPHPSTMIREKTNTKSNKAHIC